MQYVGWCNVIVDISSTVIGCGLICIDMVVEYRWVFFMVLFCSGNLAQAYKEPSTWLIVSNHLLVN